MTNQLKILEDTLIDTKKELEKEQDKNWILSTQLVATMWMLSEDTTLQELRDNVLNKCFLYKIMTHKTFIVSAKNKESAFAIVGITDIYFTSIEEIGLSKIEEGIICET